MGVAVGQLGPQVWSSLRTLILTGYIRSWQSCFLNKENRVKARLLLIQRVEEEMVAMDTREPQRKTSSSSSSSSSSSAGEETWHQAAKRRKAERQEEVNRLLK